MADYYAVTLTIRGFPARAVKVKAMARGDVEWKEADIDFERIASRLADEFREGFASSECVLHWDSLRAAMDHIGPPERMTWSPDPAGTTGTVEMDWPELAYGTAELEDRGLPALRAMGLGFFACDDGKYENAGAFHEWRPGWPEVVSGSYHSSTGRLLSSADWTRIVQQGESLEAIIEAVGRFFDADRREADSALRPFPA